MALATQCPHCQTTFRVAHDQLKLRAGLVRCGACQEIFNGIEHLQHLELAATVPSEPRLNPASAAEAPNLPRPTPVFATLPTETSLENAPPDHQVEPVSPPLNVATTAFSTDNTDDEPLARMTLMHVTEDAESQRQHDAEPDLAHAPWHDSQTNSQVDTSANETETSSQAAFERQATEEIALPAEQTGLLAHRSTHQSTDELDQAIDYLQRKPWRGSKKSVSRADIEGNLTGNFTSETDEPNFVVRSRLKRQHKTIVRIFFALLAGLLLMSAVAQGVYQWHDLIAARLPASRDTMDWVCQRLGCHIELPAQIDAVSIESNELVTAAAAKNAFSLTLLLRNRSNLQQQWPAIELTLLDTADRPVLRRVLEAGDYLPRDIDSRGGFAQNSEQTAKISFELTQQKVANYRVLLFYP